MGVSDTKMIPEERVGIRPRTLDEEARGNRRVKTWRWGTAQ